MTNFLVTPDTDNLKKKLRNFGLSDTDYMERLERFPRARISKSVSREGYAWCQSHFNNDWIWSAPVHTNYVDIYFKQREMALLFKRRFNTI